MWFGREGRHGVCMVVNSCCVFQTMTPNAYIYLCLYFINNLFQYHAKSYKDFKQQREEKKTIKKLVQTF